jgi:two-component system CitB family sensor kinase
VKHTPWHRQLVAQAMALQLAVIAVVLVVVSLAFARTGQAALEEQYGLRAQAVAESIAEIPQIRQLVDSDTISPDIQAIAEAVRVRTGVDFVVVTNADGVRYSHPNPERIGHPVSTDPGPALAGVSDWYVQTGTLGRSVRGKVPVWDVTGEEVVGIVSVGTLSGEVSQTLRSHLAGLLLAAAIAFAAGAMAAYLGARRIRSQTLGLEPPQIAALYEHRDSLLRALHEGVLAVDSEGCVTLVNERGVAMLDLNVESADQRLEEREGLEPLLHLFEAGTAQVDVPLQIGKHALLVTCAPIVIRNQREGAVFTFRDRSELKGLVSELETAQGLVDALRAQAHEHSNNLHTISGLIELDRHDDVLSIVSDHSAAQRELADLFDHRGGADSLIVATLLAKAAIAGERDIRLHTHIDKLPQTEVRFSRDMVTVISNLVDNAVEHLSEAVSAGGQIEVRIWFEDGSMHIDITDSGLGIEPDALEAVFDRGYTTKDVRSHDGLGLALVSDIVHTYGGSISVDSDLGFGTHFSIEMPLTRTGGMIDA